MPTQEALLAGHSIIAGRETAGRGGTVNGYDPATNQALEPAYSLIDTAQLAEATAAARRRNQRSDPVRALAHRPRVSRCWRAGRSNV